MNPADALALRLQQQGLGTMGTTIFAGSGADIPQTTLAGPVLLHVLSTGGTGPMVIQNGGSLRQPAFQIVARHKKFDVAEAMAYAAYAVMNFTDTQIADVFFLWCRPVQEPFDLGKDGVGNARSVFNVNTCWR